MPAYFDSDLSGDGQDVFPGGEVLYLIVHVTDPGVEARQPSPLVADQYVRIGWLALGDNLSLIGGARDYWREPIWLNFLDTLWTPDPSSNTPNPLGLVATRIRWHLGVGAAAHCYVFGR